MEKYFLLLLLFGTPALMAQQPRRSIPVRLSFRDALELAVSNSPLLAAARAGQDIARAEQVTAGLRPNPVFLLNSESYPIFTSHPGPFLNNQELVTNITQEIETGGKRQKRIEVARLGVSISEAESADLKRRFAADLAQSYFQIVLAKADLEVARQILSDFDQVLKVTRDRFRVGEISGLELQRLEVERLRFSDDVAAGEIELKNAKAQLLSLMGYDQLATDYDATDSLNSAPVAASVEQLRNDALTNRADWAAQQLRLSQSDASIRLEEAQRSPNLLPFFGYKRDLGANTASVGIQVPLPLFSRNQGGIARAYAEKRRQEFLQSQLRLVIQAEVQQAYDSFEGNQARAVLLESEYLPKASQTVETVRMTYRLGAADLITFLDAQRAYREITRSYSRTLFDTIRSRYQLEAAVGKVLP